MLRLSAYIFTLYIVLSLSSCSIKSSLRKTLDKSPNLSENFTGFYLYDIENETVIFEKMADKYFVPASNTKILTLFAALKILGDSIPAFYYRQSADSLIIWGSGSPLFLHHYFPMDASYSYLSNFRGQLYISQSNFFDTPFGPGWSWDNMPYYYSAERSSFPVYGNVARVQSINDSVKVEPQVLKMLLARLYAPERPGWRFSRSWNSSIINFRPGNNGDTAEREIPFQTSKSLLKLILEDTLRRDVKFLDLPIADFRGFYISNTDSLYKRMMQESDNFLAEQILLTCSGRISDSLSSEIAINYILKNHLSELPDPPVWVDGSGLSRINLISPRDMGIVLHRIYTMLGMQGIKEIFAAGGKSGTIRNLYKMDPPFIYAKTGTLTGVHNLSGYLIAKSGKVLIFSFMNNNYRGPSAPFKEEMDSVLRLIHRGF